MDERKAIELNQALEELNNSEAFQLLIEGLEPTVLLSSLTSSGILMTFGTAPASHEYRLLWSSLRIPLKEYQEVIEGIVQVGTAGGRGRYEAMDYGKKVVHDEAGELLQELLEEIVEIPLSTARRLFTLLFLLKTELPSHMVQYHRSHF
jgi:uncharacterized protein (UPF0262 family)